MIAKTIELAAYRIGVLWCHRWDKFGRIRVVPFFYGAAKYSPEALRFFMITFFDQAKEIGTRGMP